VADRPIGFVALKSLKQGPPDPAGAIAEIRRIYFATTKKTIDNDFAHAIELLKSLPDEETRDRVAVFMDGLQQMRMEWAAPGDGKGDGKGKGQRAKGKSRGKGQSARSNARAKRPKGTA
jgi:hypothetical protein